MSTATITAKSGPAIQATALPLTGINSILFDLQREVLQLFTGSPLSGPANQFELTGSNTITLTVSGGVYTLTVS